MLKDREPVLLEEHIGHYYETDTGDVYPSVNTILQATLTERKRKGLVFWKEREPAHTYITEQAKHVGTQCHKIIENYLTTNKMDHKNMDLLPIAHFENLLPYLDKISNVVAVEQRMCYHAWKVAGTADLIAEYDGELSIIDYKTKRKPQEDRFMYEYYLQTTCYAQMFRAITGTEIKQVVILVSSEKNTRQEFVKNCSEYIEPMWERIKEYYRSRDGSED